MTQQYFDNEVDYDAEIIEKFESKLATSSAPPNNLARFAYSIFRKRHENLFLRYSQGEKVSEIEKRFPAVVTSLERYLGIEGHQEIRIDQSLDDYVTALWLLSWALLFRIDDALFDRLLNCIGNVGKDSLLERLIATRVQGRPSSERLAWPDIYHRLNRSLEASAETKPGILRDFLESWYPSLKKAYWYENHRGKDGGGFFGYWCIEAAAVVKVSGIDDEVLREMRYYPKDLISLSSS